MVQKKTTPAEPAQFFEKDLSALRRHAAWRIENDVVHDRQQLRHVLGAERRREHVVLLPRHFLVREPRLEETARRRAIEVLRHERVQREARKRLLREQYLHSRPV